MIGLQGYHCSGWFVVLPASSSKVDMVNIAWHETWNNRLVPNRKRSTSRLYIVTLLISLICRVHHEKTLGWKKHKQESRLPGEITITSDMQMTPPLWQKVKRNSKASWWKCEELTHWKRFWCWEGLGAGGEGDDRGWDGWMASLTRWMWVWVNSGSLWWTGRPGVLRFTGLQRVRHDWTELTHLNGIVLLLQLWASLKHVYLDEESHTVKNAAS